MMRLLTVASLLAASGVDAALKVGKDGPDDPHGILIVPKKGVPLDKAVLARAEHQLSLASAANAEAGENAKAMGATQQELVAHLAEDAAEDAYDGARPAVPLAQKGVTEARVWALKAQNWARHAATVEDSAKLIAGKAAKKAAFQIQQQIQAEAYASAVKAGSQAGESAKAREMTITNRIAAAVEPYHIEMLREQKIVKETYGKAQSAQKSATSLAANAGELASKAQALQAAGAVIESQQLMTMAHGTMADAMKMKGWAAKLYDEANKVNTNFGYWQLAQGQAAANVAGNTLVNVPPTLPGPPSVGDFKGEVLPPPPGL